MKRRTLWPIVLLVLGTNASTTGALAQYSQAPAVEKVETMGMTVTDMLRAVQLYSSVLSFEKVSDVEVNGRAYEQLQDLFGLRMRMVRMRLGWNTSS